MLKSALGQSMPCVTICGPISGISPTYGSRNASAANTMPSTILTGVDCRLYQPRTPPLSFLGAFAGADFVASVVMPWPSRETRPAGPSDGPAGSTRAARTTRRAATGAEQRGRVVLQHAQQQAAEQ